LFEKGGGGGEPGGKGEYDALGKKKKKEREEAHSGFSAEFLRCGGGGGTALSCFEGKKRGDWHRDPKKKNGAHRGQA